MFTVEGIDTACTREYRSSVRESSDDVARPEDAHRLR